MSDHRAVADIPRTGGRFKVISEFKPSGDQPAAIEELATRINRREKDVVLLGATGTGKSATTAWLIEKVQRPTLVMAPNKTLAAQLANELRELFPNNAVEYFVSYYDYYQPEAYVPQTDTFIEKDSSINSDVERLRHSATRSLLSRRDVIVVASVSCIYGLGTPQSYLDRSLPVHVGMTLDRDQLLRMLVDVQYSRNDLSFTRGSFRVRGDTVEIIPAYEELALRIEFFGDDVERLFYLRPLTEEVRREMMSCGSPSDPLRRRTAADGRASATSKPARRAAGRVRVAGQAAGGQRLRLRTNYDLEMLKRSASPPASKLLPAHRRPRPRHSAATLLDYFPDDFLLVVDESHVTVPQINDMYKSDAARKRPWSSTASGCQRNGQPAVDLGGVRRPDRPDGLPLGDSRSVRARPHPGGVR